MGTACFNRGLLSSYVLSSIIECILADKGPGVLTTLWPFLFPLFDAECTLPEADLCPTNYECHDGVANAPGYKCSEYGGAVKYSPLPQVRPEMTKP